MLRQLLHDPVEPCAVLAQQAARLGAAVVADPADLVVDGLEHGVGDAFHPRLAVLGQHGHRPDALGHPHRAATPRPVAGASRPRIPRLR